MIKGPNYNQSRRLVAVAWAGAACLLYFFLWDKLALFHDYYSVAWSNKIIVAFLLALALYLGLWLNRRRHGKANSLPPRGRLLLAVGSVLLALAGAEVVLLVLNHTITCVPFGGDCWQDGQGVITCQRNELCHFQPKLMWLWVVPFVLMAAPWLVTAWRNRHHRLG